MQRYSTQINNAYLEKKTYQKPQTYHHQKNKAELNGKWYVCIQLIETYEHSKTCPKQIGWTTKYVVAGRFKGMSIWTF